MSKERNEKAFVDWKETQDSLTEHLKSQLKDNQTFTSAFFTHTDLFTGTPGVQFEANYDQEAKSGRVTSKTDKVLIQMKYNPLTGDPFFLDNDTEDENQATEDTLP